MARRSAPVPAILSIGLAILLAGCSSSDAKTDTGRVTAGGTSGSGSSPSSSPSSSAAPTGKVSLAKVGFGSDRYLTSLIAQVDNSTGDAVGVTVNFGIYDASGKVLVTESGATVVIRSHDSQIIADTTSTPKTGKISKVDAQVSTGESEKDQHPNSKMTIAAVTLQHVEYVGYKATGQITSTYTSTVSNVYVGVMCQSASGAVNGGGFTFLQANVAPSQKTPFEVSLNTTGVPAKCHATATPSNLSEAK